MLLLAAFGVPRCLGIFRKAEEQVATRRVEIPQSPFRTKKATRTMKYPSRCFFVAIGFFSSPASSLPVKPRHNRKNRKLSPHACFNSLKPKFAPVGQALLRLPFHGSRQGRRKSPRRFAARLLKGGDSGPAVVVGDPRRSLLMKAVLYEDLDLAMAADRIRRQAQSR